MKLMDDTNEILLDPAIAAWREFKDYMAAKYPDCGNMAELAREALWEVQGHHPEDYQAYVAIFNKHFTQGETE